MGSALAISMSITVIAPLVIIQPAYARPIVSALPDDATKTAAQLGGAELIGYQVKNDRVRAGEQIEVVTYWHKATADVRSLSGIVTLLAPDGQLVGRAESLLGSDAYPVEVWQSSDIVATHFRVPTQTEHPTIAAMQLQAGDQSQSIDLGRVVVEVDRVCEGSRVADATFGGSIKLRGYRIEEGAVPHIVLCWQALKPMPIDYTVFVHVSDDTALISGDAQPVGGNYPTSAWRPGEIIEDVHTLPANGDLKIPQASIGLYRLDTGERLSIDGTDATEFELIK
jgi:hypothetical protein